MTPRNVPPSDLIRVQCTTATLPGFEAYDVPRSWTILTTKQAIEAAESSGRKRLVPTYQPDGTKTTHMLCHLAPGLRRAWENKHGFGVVHLNFIHNARQASRYGCKCEQCTSPEASA